MKTHLRQVNEKKKSSKREKKGGASATDFNEKEHLTHHVLLWGESRHITVVALEGGERVPLLAVHSWLAGRLPLAEAGPNFFFLFANARRCGWCVASDKTPVATKFVAVGNAGGWCSFSRRDR